MTTRRDVIQGGLAGMAGLALLAMGAGPAQALGSLSEAGYGLIGQMKAQPGQRAALIAILHEGLDEMPGNLAFIVGADAGDPDSIWITELWTTKQAHDDALKLPAVTAAIEKGRPLIAGMGTRVEFNPT
jgi:quinol monooxygenase YgiN